MTSPLPSSAPPGEAKGRRNAAQATHARRHIDPRPQSARARPNHARDPHRAVEARHTSTPNKGRNLMSKNSFTRGLQANSRWIPGVFTEKRPLYPLFKKSGPLSLSVSPTLCTAMEAGGATREARRARAERCGAAREPERCVRRSAAARKVERGTRGARGLDLLWLRPPPPDEVVTGDRRRVLRRIWPQGPRIQWRIEGGGASSFSQCATAFFHGGWARSLLLQASDDALSNGSGLGARGSIIAVDLAMAVEVQWRGGVGTVMQW